MTTRTLLTRGHKRLLAAAVVALLGLGLGLGIALGTGSSDPYLVRAIFDDAANLTSGEQVKIAGVPVGSVEAIQPTPQAKAAVVLSINRAGFQDFRADASCTIKPQSLLGENYVDCVPTQPREPGAPEPPPLQVIQDGREGAGERLLPLENTSSPVLQDLPLDINHLPERERLRIILNELGAGLEGRGSDLHAVILRANPALRETNRVLRILANENEILQRLAVNGDRVLAPLAAVRKKFADYLVQSNKLSTASARHAGQLERNLADFPPFLEALGPAMERIGRFGEETTPVMRELGLAAPGLNRLFAALPGYSRASTKYFKSLGSFAKTAGPALKASEPLLENLESLGRGVKPFASNFATLLGNFRETGGIERLMDFIYTVAGATNGYDALGHFLRADLISEGSCTPYVAEPRSECKAHFFEEEGSGKTAGAAALASSAAPASIASLLAALPHSASAASEGGGATGAVKRRAGAATPEGQAAQPAVQGKAPGEAPAAGGASGQGGASGEGRASGEGGPSGSRTASGASGRQARRALLNYLLGE